MSEHTRKIPLSVSKRAQNARVVCPTLYLIPFIARLLFVSILHIEIVVPIFTLLLLDQSLRALGHALIHKGEEADRASADAHAVDEAGREEGAENGAKVGVGDLWHM